MGQYPRGDLVFDIGTVIHGVNKGWPMKIIETDRNNFTAYFGIPKRQADDGYHAYLALYNHESTVGHYVRVVDDTAEYPYLEFHSKVELWSAGSYDTGRIVLRNGNIYRSSAADVNTAPSSGSDNGWELHSSWRDYDLKFHEPELYCADTDFPLWSGESCGRGVIVRHTDGSLYVSTVEHNTSSPDSGSWERYTPGEWSAYITYTRGCVVKHSGVIHVSASQNNVSEPDPDNTDWTVYTAGEWNGDIIYAGGDIVLHNDIPYVSSADDNIGNDPEIHSRWEEYTGYTPITSAGAGFGTEVSAGGNIFMTARLKNGVTEDNTYAVSLSGLNPAKQTFQVIVYENINGKAEVAEGPFTAGLTPGSLKADGSPLFIEAVCEQYSQIVDFEVDEENADFRMITETRFCWFRGGSPGGTPGINDYKKAWDLFKKTEVDQLFMAGDIDIDHIQSALEAAEEKQIRLEADTPGGTPEAAAAWVQDNMGIFQSHLLSFTYGRVSFRDPFYSGSRKTLGMSGFASAAKAYGRHFSKTMIDAGVEEVPAGENFGLLRGAAGIRNETPLSEDDQKILAERWLNYILNSSRAGIILWEQFTCYGDESPLAYKRTVDVMNYVYKIHQGIMQENQFRGKSDQEIINLLTPLLQRLQTKGVLVSDITGDSDYPDPFHIWITAVQNKRQIHRMMRISRAVGPIILKTILA